MQRPLNNAVVLSGSHQREQRDRARGVGRSEVSPLGSCRVRARHACLAAIDDHRVRARLGAHAAQLKRAPNVLQGCAFPREGVADPELPRVHEALERRAQLAGVRERHEGHVADHPGDDGGEDKDVLHLVHAAGVPHVEEDALSSERVLGVREDDPVHGHLEEQPGMEQEVQPRAVALLGELVPEEELEGDRRQEEAHGDVRPVLDVARVYPEGVCVHRHDESLRPPEGAGVPLPLPLHLKHGEALVVLTPRRRVQAQLRGRRGDDEQGLSGVAHQPAARVAAHERPAAGVRLEAHLADVAEGGQGDVEELAVEREGAKLQLAVALAEHLHVAMHAALLDIRADGPVRLDLLQAGHVDDAHVGVPALLHEGIALLRAQGRAAGRFEGVPPGGVLPAVLEVHLHLWTGGS
mmetsp:Transcript_9505/g.32221  ORF Transcript_9505/g.32221 Transcript_9505/m.32221 type:complete len:409 (+) Transcript_9505:274-1500(+)